MPVNSTEDDSINFRQAWRILKRRWLATTVVVSSVVGVTGAVTFSQTPIYEAEGKLIFNKANLYSSLTGITVGQELEMLGRSGNAGNPLDTQAEIIRSQPVIQKTIETLELKNKNGQPLVFEEFSKNLKVSGVKGTDVLRVSYRSSDKKMAAAIVDSLITHYLENDIRTNRAEVVAAREFISKQLPEVEAKVRESELAVRQFKEKNRVVELQEEAKTSIANQSDLADQIIKTEAKFVDTSSQIVALQNKLGLSSQKALALNTLSQSKAVQQLLDEFRQTQNKLAVERIRYSDEHPTIIDLASKVQVLRQQLEQRIIQTLGTVDTLTERDLNLDSLKQNLIAELVKLEVERTGLSNRISTLSNALNLYRQRANIIPRLEQNQRQLERNLQVARQTYEQLLRRLQEVQVIENKTVGNARVVSQALVADDPVSPRTALNLALGGFLGIILAVGAALMLEALDGSVRTLEEAQELLGYPLLGTIPRLSISRHYRNRDISTLPIRDNPWSPASAAFEKLQATLEYTLPDQVLKSIVITSAVPNEGKSFVSANLALALAQLGRRVLIIDADMRCSHQHEIWKIENSQGLNEILEGKLDLQTSAHQVANNVYLLPAGATPSNPFATLASPQMNALVTMAQQQYDFVIIDTPPVIYSADALALGKFVDGALLIVRPGAANSAVSKEMKTLLKQSSQRVLGMVVNDVTDENDYYYGYGIQKGYYRLPITAK
ncbi:MAG: polysaccharide biosynthesis tyrosine autokinase [Calothrix sp. C42_A2020_038]|nr:polysaccharide biosynthesis tyrosine autokinase [Calothrix sp. C42_A2020_038]